MSAHTPGPWREEAQPYDSSSFYIRGSDKNGNELTWGKGAVAHIPRSTVMPMQANARLIAASPDLLEALERLSAQCTRLRLPGQAVTDAEKSALAAIEKATGKA